VAAVTAARENRERREMRVRRPLTELPTKAMRHASSGREGAGRRAMGAMREHVRCFDGWSAQRRRSPGLLAERPAANVRQRGKSPANAISPVISGTPHSRRYERKMNVQEMRPVEN
jgi:hypothetical protein